MGSEQVTGQTSRSQDPSINRTPSEQVAFAQKQHARRQASALFSQRPRLPASLLPPLCLRCPPPFSGVRLLPRPLGEHPVLISHSTSSRAPLPHIPSRRTFIVSLLLEWSWLRGKVYAGLMSESLQYCIFPRVYDAFRWHTGQLHVANTRGRTRHWIFQDLFNPLSAFQIRSRTESQCGDVSLTPPTSAKLPLNKEVRLQAQTYRLGTDHIILLLLAVASDQEEGN